MVSQKIGLKLELLEDRTLLSSGLKPEIVIAQAGSDALINSNGSHLVGHNTAIRGQGYDGSSAGAVAQQFTDFTSFSSYEFDDFQTSVNYNVNRLRVPGQEFGVASANLAVEGVITDGTPGNTIMVGSGHETASGALVINFGGQFLPAGNYWVTAFVVRGFGTGGQWFWDRTLDTHHHTGYRGSQEYFWNPGGGFGFGTSAIPGSAIFGSAEDMAFRLTGTAAAPNQAAATINQSLASVFNTGAAAIGGHDLSQHHDLGLDQAYAMGLMN